MSHNYWDSKKLATVWEWYENKYWKLFVNYVNIDHKESNSFSILTREVNFTKSYNLFASIQNAYIQSRPTTKVSYMPVVRN